MNTISKIALAFVMSSIGFTTAAEARLEHSTTSVEANAPEIGANLTLAFSAPVDASASRVEIRDSKGRSVQIGKLKVASNGTDIQIPLGKPLNPDRYTIRWRAVSNAGLVDTGGYDFTIDPMPVGGNIVAER